MTVNILLHPQTEQNVAAYLKKPTHALLITGEEGSGKTFLAQTVSNELHTSNFVLSAEDGKKSITIDQVRTLYGLTKTGTPLVVIIQDAHQLTKEAQNAFLKLLEEPPSSVKFILTASKPEKILPTIRSRVQELRVTPPGKNRLIEHAQGSELGKTELTSLAHTSKGLAGLFISALEDTELRNSRKASVEEAKHFYVSEPYQRHLICIEHNYDRAWAEELLETLALILESLLKAVPPGQITAIIRQASLVEETAQNVLNINGNPKIHLAKLSQQL